MFAYQNSLMMQDETKQNTMLIEHTYTHIWNSRTYR